MKFDWDAHNLAHCRKHGATTAEVEWMLRDARTRVVGDPFDGEERFRATGGNKEGRRMFVVFTMRRSKIRPISARYRHRDDIDEEADS